MFRGILLLLSLTLLVIWAGEAGSTSYRNKDQIRQQAEERRQQENVRAENKKTEALNRSVVGIDRRKQVEDQNRIEKEKARRIEVINNAEKEALKRAQERERQNVASKPRRIK